MKLKALIFVFLSVFSITQLHAQDGAPGPGTITVFAESGDKFTLYLNEERKNAQPESRVVVNNFVSVPVAFRIVFADGSIPELKKRGIRQGVNCTYVIIKNKKGERVLRAGECTNEPAPSTQPSAPSVSAQPVVQTPAPQSTPSQTTASAPSQLSATYANGVITISDGRTLSVKKSESQWHDLSSRPYDITQWG